MMNRSVCMFFTLVLAASCAVQHTSLEQPETKTVYAVVLRHYNDSCGQLCNRVVFTKIPCEKRRYINSKGKVLKAMQTEADRDSLCVSCSDMDNPKAVMMEPVAYGNAYEYSLMTYYSRAEISISGPGCTKPVIELRDSLNDPTDYVSWQRLDKQKGLLVLYKAKDTAVFPYYVPHTLDSFVYNLKQFCTDAERLENKQGMQKLAEKYCRAEINPNPFQESIEFTLINEQWTWLTSGKSIELVFLDLNGNTISRSLIEANKPYTFSFPDLKSGSLLFYKISWDEYLLSGQIKKM